MSRSVRRYVARHHIGLLALFVALSGTAYAAVQLPKNSVKSKHIANSTIKGIDVKNKSLTPADFNGSVQGPVGAQGPTGPAGPTGQSGATGATGPAGSPDTPQQVLDKIKQVDGAGSNVDADQLDGLEAAAFLPASGATKLQFGPGSFVAGAAGGTVDYFANQARLHNPTASGGPLFFTAAITLPSTLQGQTVRIDNLELCYDATSPTATLDRITLHQGSGTAALPISGGSSPIDDATDRDDATCRTYSGSSPVTIGPTDFVQLVVRNNYTASGFVAVGRLTLNLST